jgi:hypothetical protein
MGVDADKVYGWRTCRRLGMSLGSFQVSIVGPFRCLPMRVRAHPFADTPPTVFAPIHALHAVP